MQVTPTLLREYRHRIAVQPPGAQDPQDWEEMTDLFGRAFEEAAAEIERLTSELAVRDRALEIGVRDLTRCDPETIREDVAGFVDAARAEIEKEAAND